MRRFAVSGERFAISDFKFAIISTLIVWILGLGSFAQAKEKWPGMDQAVIEQYAAKQGRPPAKPLVRIEGDALLFAFILAGAVGGFILGYNWHKLFKSKEKV